MCRTLLAPFTAAAFLALAGCGGGGTPQSAPSTKQVITPPTPSSTSAPTVTTGAVASDTAAAASVSSAAAAVSSSAAALSSQAAALSAARSSASAATRSSASSTTAARTTQAPAAVGETVTYQTSKSAGTLTLNSAHRVTGAPNRITSPPKNGTYLIIDVTLTVNSGTMTANPGFWKAQDPQGYTYTAQFAGVAEQGIDSGEIPAGQKTRGEIAFDVPPGPLTVTLNPFTGPVATFTIDR